MVSRLDPVSLPLCVIHPSRLFYTVSFRPGDFRIGENLNLRISRRKLNFFGLRYQEDCLRINLLIDYVIIIT